MRRDLHKRDLTLLPVAVYARLSQNPDGSSESVDTQIKAGRRRAEELWPGREIVVFSDDDLSAADDTVFRPGYEKMLESIRRGLIGAVITRNQGRISRSEKIWPEFKVACSVAGITVLHTTTGGDVPIADGQSLGADIVNLVNAEYAKQMKLAQLDTLEQRTVEGRPTGGRPYGYLPVRNERNEAALVIVPDQAAEIRSMAEKVLAGWSLANIARDLNERSVPTPRGGKKWESMGVRGAVTSPAVAGYYVRHKKIVGRGVWEPILDEDTWRSVRFVLDNPRTIVRSDGMVYNKRHGSRRPSRRYLLTGGIAICGRIDEATGEICGAPLVAQVQTARNGDRVPMYLCKAQRTGGCGRLGIKAEPTEDHIGEKLLAYLDTPAYLQHLAAGDVDAERRDELGRERLALEHRRVETAQQVVKGAMSPAMAAMVEQGIDQELRRVAAEESALAPLNGHIDAETIKATWADMTLDKKRAILFDLHCSVVVAPAFGPRVFNPERVSVDFGGQRPSAII